MLNFSEWLKLKEMTSTSSVGGGSTSTGDIAHFSRRLFELPIERGIKKKRKMTKSYFSSLENTFNSTKLNHL